MILTLWSIEAIGALFFGLLIGSFLNVCIYRLPRDISPAKGRSYCPQCHHTISWYDNVPLLSFLWLLGRCRYCKAPISVRYPMVEALTGLLALATFAHHPQPLAFFLYFLLFVSPLIVIVFIDLDTLTIPDVITLPGIVVGVVVRLLLAPHDWMHALTQSAAGIAVGGGLLLFLAWYALRIRGKEGMGGGDIKLAAMLGAFLGPVSVLMILVMASLLGLIIGGGTLLFARKGRETPIPFGPFLALAALIDFFFHHGLWRMLLRWQSA